MANLTNKDVEYFRERFPYLAGKIKPQANTNSAQPNRISIGERNKKFQEMAKELFKANPSETKKNVAHKIYEILKETDPSYIKGADGQLISVGTIERSIKTIGKNVKRR